MEEDLSAPGGSAERRARSRALNVEGCTLNDILDEHDEGIEEPA